MIDLIFKRLPLDGGLESQNITGRFGETVGYPAPHRGIDFGVNEGTPVYAPAAGLWVTNFTNDGSYGIAACLDHVDTPWWTLYGHLSKLAPGLVVGMTVGAGQLIGWTGNTGLSTGPHLHWQVCDDLKFPRDIARSKDPLSFYRPPVPMLPAAEIALLWKVVGGREVAPNYDLLAGLQETQRAVASLARQVAELADVNTGWQARDDLIASLRELADGLEAKP